MPNSKVHVFIIALYYTLFQLCGRFQITCECVTRRNLTSLRHAGASLDQRRTGGVVLTVDSLSVAVLLAKCDVTRCLNGGHIELQQKEAVVDGRHCHDVCGCKDTKKNVASTLIQQT